MRKVTLDSVKDCDCIFSNGEYVILSGKNPWIFRQDGTFVAKLKTIRHAYVVVFLPQNTALLNGGGSDKYYHYVSLCDGQILWSCPKSGRRDLGGNPLTVSPGGQTAYCVYSINQVLHVDIITPKENRCVTYSIPLGIRATYHSYCDVEGNLYFLQSFAENLPRDYDEEDHSYYINGVLKWSPSLSEPVWVQQWSTPPRAGRTLKKCNEEYVLFDNFTVRSFKTGEEFNLLENEPKHSRSPGGFRCAYDRERSLLTVNFTSSCSTVVIDCKMRKIVAHYVPISPGLNSGCLIGDEFWIGTRDGVIKRPFPHMDEFPRRL